MANSKSVSLYVFMCLQTSNMHTTELIQRNST